MSIDPTTYTSIVNEIDWTNQSNANWLSLNYYNDNPRSGTPSNDVTNALSSTTIKRACCLNRGNPNKHNVTDEYPVKVRLPIPSDMDTTNLLVNEKRYGYYDKIINIPSEMCLAPQYNSYTYASNACDDFMDLYCHSTRALLLNENEQQGISDGAFNGSLYYYKPECACFSDNIEFDVANVQSNCYKAGCYTNSDAYMTKESRNPFSPYDTLQCPMNVTICKAIIDMEHFMAGNNIDISGIDVTLACGDKYQGTSLPNPSSTPSSTPSPTPSDLFPISSYSTTEIAIMVVVVVLLVLILIVILIK